MLLEEIELGCSRIFMSDQSLLGQWANEMVALEQSLGLWASLSSMQKPCVGLGRNCAYEAGLRVVVTTGAANSRLRVC
jgi:hypothetical protein